MTALAGRTIALSIGDAADRAKLGFPAREIDRALLTICMTLVRAGAEILYAGDLRPAGFTFKVFRHLVGAYASEPTIPFIHVIPEPVLRRTPFEAIRDALKERRGTARTVFGLDEKLVPVRWGGDVLRIGVDDAMREIADAAEYDKWRAEVAHGTPAEGFSAVRLATARIAHGRVAIGGKMGLVGDPDDQYEGAMPGVIEEAILTLTEGKALVPLGAFGGATRDVAIALGLLDAGARVPRGPQAGSYAPAVEAVARLRDRLPGNLIERLRSVADDDQTERVAHEVRDILAAWPV